MYYLVGSAFQHVVDRCGNVSMGYCINQRDLRQRNVVALTQNSRNRPFKFGFPFFASAFAYIYVDAT